MKWIVEKEMIVNYKRFIFKGLIKKQKYTGKSYHFTAHSVTLADLIIWNKQKSLQGTCMNTYSILFIGLGYIYKTT